MTDTELIARQAKQIEELTDQVKECQEAISKCQSIAYCIGGPLNDNNLKFNPSQQKVVWDMVRVLEEAL